MRFLRRYIATTNKHNKLFINEYEIATNSTWYIYVRNIVFGVDETVVNGFTYAYDRKLYNKCKKGYTSQMPLISFAYPYVTIYTDTRLVHFGKTISVAKYDAVFDEAEN